MAAKCSTKAVLLFTMKNQNLISRNKRGKVGLNLLIKTASAHSQELNRENM